MNTEELHLASWRIYGMRRFAEAWNSGESLAAVLNGLARTATTNSGVAAYSGAYEMAFTAIDVARGRRTGRRLFAAKAGRYAYLDDQTVDLRLRFNSLFSGRDFDAAQAFCNDLVAALEQLRRCDGMRLNVKTREASTEKNNGPQEVRVVSMPERQTSTAIARDTSGSITGSVAVEKDAA